jgi:pyruvate,water dikinase
LNRKGFVIPQTYVCTWEAYQRWLQGDPDVLHTVREELAQMLGSDSDAAAYAVRSSANVEDASAHSFAGQFRTVLNVRGQEEILCAIEQIWSHVRSPSMEAYLEQVGLEVGEIKMAVLIQAMVPSIVSGVSFSANPVTGMSEVIVEAVQGSGEALVQGGVQPKRWVNKWGTWIETPSGTEPAGGTIQGALIDRVLVERVVDETRAIAKTYGKPVDLEWVWDGETLTWVQVREITGLDLDIYSNKISKEVFPGLIKPLVWSVNVPLVNSAWVRLFTELIGPNDIDPNNLAQTFYNRAYFNMGTIGRIFELLGFPRESLELLMGIEMVGSTKPSFKPTAKTFTFMPRMLVVAIGKLGFARSIKAFVPAARAQYERFADQLLHAADCELSVEDKLDEQQLLQYVDRLYALTRESAYYNIVTPLLMQAYNALFKGQLARAGLEAEDLDWSADLVELGQYDPAPHLVALHEQYTTVGAAVRAQTEKQGYAALVQLGAESFRADLDRFLDQFGHLSDSGNDFSVVPWRETPDLVLDMVRAYPALRQAEAKSARWQDLEIPAVRKVLLRPLYRRASQFRVHREAVSSLYTYGYGLFRYAFLALGARFAERGLFTAPEDVFYLDLDQVRSLVMDGPDAGLLHQVELRKQALEANRDLVPPDVIYGSEAPDLQQSASDTWEGTPTSRGRYRGPVRVVQGIQDFPKVQQGDVLVIPYADVGWTPLFARAGAVIAESGGMLSHSSIVAREYKIPAVISVANASRLADDTFVTVDGYRGAITVHTS